MVGMAASLVTSIMKDEDSKLLPQLLRHNLRQNRRHVLRDIPGFARGHAILRIFRNKLRELAQEIPGTAAAIHAVHFIVKRREVEIFPFYAAMAVLSARASHPDAILIVFGTSMPKGQYWELVRSHVRFVAIPPFKWFGPASILSDTQRLNLARLLALLEIGGIAMDCDTLTLRNMDDLASWPFVLGTQPAIPGTRSTFGHAILASRRDSLFAAAWLDAYKSFDANGGDLSEALFASELPMHLYASNPSAAHILPHYRWFFPLWHRARDYLFNEQRSDAFLELTSDQYVLPLWSDVIGNALEAWHPALLIERRCVYATLCLAVLRALPEQVAREVRPRLGWADQIPAVDQGRLTFLIGTPI